MDELTLFTGLQPPPPEQAGAIEARARDRLAAAMTAPPRRRLPAWLLRAPARRRQRPGLRRFALAGSAAAACGTAAAVIAVTLTGSDTGTLHTGGQARGTAYVISLVR